MTQAGFGEHLRREREMRGVSLEEIAGATRISTRFLDALEKEAWDRLPGGVFNRGFVRTVARFLGLANIVPLQLTGDAAVATPWGVLPLAGPPPAGATRLLIRPDSMSLDPKGPLRGVVAALTFRGDHTTVHVNPLSGDGPALEVRLRETDPPAVGQTVALSVDRPGVLFLS